MKLVDFTTNLNKEEKKEKIFIQTTSASMKGEFEKIDNRQGFLVLSNARVDGKNFASLNISIDSIIAWGIIKKKEAGKARVIKR